MTIAERSALELGFVRMAEYATDHRWRAFGSAMLDALRAGAPESASYPKFAEFFDAPMAGATAARGFVDDARE